MEQSFRLLSTVAAKSFLTLVFIFSAAIFAQAQGPTPEPFVLQITNSTIPGFSPSPSPSPSPSATPTPTPLPVNVNSFAQGISGNGRFVVIESNGDIATRNPNNRDGNREIFLFDYAQRRIFQITNTRHALKDVNLSPTSSNNIEVEVSNVRPVISYDGRWIVFSSNAFNDANGSTPKSFDGNAADNLAVLKADGNMEIFLYRIPDIAEADLASGVELPETSLSGGAITRVTNTPATFLPTPGTTDVSPQVADDNRFPQVNDDASIIAFVSSRDMENIPGGPNTDKNPEIFAAKRTTVEGATSIALAQLTSTANPSGSGASRIFNANPSLSGSGSVIVFSSTADQQLNPSIPAEPTEAQGNIEVYVADLNVASPSPEMSNVRQVTRTAANRASPIINTLSPGRRVSRNGNFLAFESRAEFSESGTVNGDLKEASVIYQVSISGSTFTFRQVGHRPTNVDINGNVFNDVFRFPTFTGDSSTIVFASHLNFRPDGTEVAFNSSEGLNPFASDAQLRTQIYAAPTSAPTSFTRLTKAPFAQALSSDAQPFPSETVNRLAFSYQLTEFGGGNSDGSYEAFYQLLKPVNSEDANDGNVSFFTSASERPVVGPSPAPTPPAVSGLAPGMLGIARATGLAPSNRAVDQNDAQEMARRPSLPVELNGVSVSINNAAAGLYFVSPNQINFVVPIGLAASSTAYTMIINNNGAVFRTKLLINPAQPDIWTSTNGAGGRAAVFNVTNPLTMTPEPPDGFPVTTDVPKPDGSGMESKATQLLLMLTGVRNAVPSQITVTIKSVAEGGKNVSLSGTAIKVAGPSRTSGFDQIIVELPADLAGAGESTIVVSANVGGQTTTSRPEDTAPHIRIR